MKKNVISSYSNIEDIHDIIDDIATSQDLTQEISEAICIPIRSEIDEDEVRKNIFLKTRIKVLNIYSESETVIIFIVHIFHSYIL